MINCRKCGAKLPDYAKFCSKCGLGVDQTFFPDKNTRPKYISIEKLGIHPGQVRYVIYKGIVEGKTYEQICDELDPEGELKKQSKSYRKRQLGYIAYFHRVMLGEEE